MKAKDAQIKELQDELDRKAFLEKKIQNYVKTLCDQNEKCKTFISQEVEDEEKVEKFFESLQNLIG